MQKKLLHIVDMQNDFVMPRGRLAVDGADSLVAPANEFLASEKFDKIIATFDTHYNKSYAHSAEAKLFPAHCIYGTRGWELAINPGRYTRVLKNQFDVWGAPRAINQAIAGFTPNNTDVYVMGVASDYCVKYAITGYLTRGYNVIVLQDLCRGIERQIDDVVAEFKNAKIKMINTNQMGR